MSGGGGKIERIELFHVDAPLPTPLFPVWIPGYPQYRQCYTLLTVTTRDGLTGYATGVAFDREREGLGDFIGRFLLGLDAYDVALASERLRQASFLGWRNHWMEIAFWDLAAKAKNVPLHEFLASHLDLELSPKVPDSIEVYASFRELRPPKVRGETIERAQRAGFRGVKINVHSFNEAEDREQLTTARTVAGKECRLLVHAHQAWSVSLVEEVPRWDLDRALRFAELAAERDVGWLQEPLHSEAWDELAELSSRSKVPIAGGDITLSFAPLKALIGSGCYSVLTPDATFAGLHTVVQTMKRCHAKGLGFSPSSNGDGLGLAANLHAVVAWSRVLGAHGTPLLEFPWEPPAVIPEHRDALLENPLHIRADGTLPVLQGPGLGVAPDPKALRRFGSKFYTLTPVRFAASSARRAGLRETVDFAKRGRGSRRRDRSPTATETT